jgi:3-oxoacyl-[acyl-carrier protein] reductase
MSEFVGQNVFVTGAASGIGLGIAHAFSEQGANVAIGDFRPDTIEEALAQFPDRSRVRAQTLDVRDADSVASFVRDSEAAFGPVTVMVANAGIYPNTPVVEMDPAEWDRVMETNARGTFLACQAAARSMVEKGTLGKIITISSGASSSGRRGAAHYCASKAAVVMFTKVLALELAEHRINVNCVSPGLIEVNSAVSPLSENYVSTLTSSIPWGRIGRPSDIAKGVMFLASPAAEFITGTVLSVDGGSSAGRASLPLSDPDRA